MNIPVKAASTAASAILLATFLSVIPAIAQSEDAAATLEEGKKLAFDRKKGNCLACHQIAGGELAGNIGPPLIAMQARFPDRSKLRTQIADPVAANENSIMPPFISHRIISEAELDKIVDFILTL